jgi:hypothetical protein
MIMLTYSLSYVGCIEACKGIIEAVQRLASEAPEKCYRRWFFLVRHICIKADGSLGHSPVAYAWRRP